MKRSQVPRLFILLLLESIGSRLTALTLTPDQLPPLPTLTPDQLSPLPTLTPDQLSPLSAGCCYAEVEQTEVPQTATQGNDMQGNA